MEKVVEDMEEIEEIIEATEVIEAEEVAEEAKNTNKSNNINKEIITTQVILTTNKEPQDKEALRSHQLHLLLANMLLNRNQHLNSLMSQLSRLSQMMKWLRKSWVISIITRIKM